MAKTSPPPPFAAYQGTEPYLFVSYAHADSAAVFPELRRLHQLGYRIWYDEGINPCEKWTEAIQRALQGACQVLAFGSPRFTASEVCQDEINLARDENKPLLIVHLEPNTLQRELRFRRIQSIHAFENPPERLHELLERGLLPSLRVTVAPSPHYRNDDTRRLGERIDALETQRAELLATGADAAQLRPVNDEILELKRQLRHGPQLEAGDYLSNRYRLIEEVGSGGFATVWKAYDKKARHPVAVKVLHGQYANSPERLERFRRGARVMHQLTHPHIVRVLDPECLDGRYPYFVMEYIAGQNFFKAVKEGTLVAEQLPQVLLQAGEALAYAHTRNAIHRDVTPDNILLDGNGSAHLTDFDLVRIEDSTGGTRTGAIGKLLYIAPECCDAAKDADARSDVFSFGMTALFGFYGKPLSRHVINRQAAYVRQLSCAEGIKTVLAKALEEEPDDRFDTMTEFCEALREASRKPQRINPPHVAHAQPEAKPPSLALRAGEAVSSSTPQVGTVITNALGMQFAWVPPGQSWLGGGGGKPGTIPFTLAEGLWCGVYPVTQEEWQKVMGDNPSHFQGNPRYPVECVSWNDVQIFLKKLNDKMLGDGFLYRLPTSEEWEYICRGGPLSQEQSQYHFYFATSKSDLTPKPTNDLSSHEANFDGNYPHGSAKPGPFLKRPCDVGSYLPNPLGIYDLHGNVWEWTSSEYEAGASYRVLRGGSWLFTGWDCRSAIRSRGTPGFRYQGAGFRLAAVPCFVGAK